jgi:hypothetical protein
MSAPTRLIQTVACVAILSAGLWMVACARAQNRDANASGGAAAGANARGQAAPHDAVANAQTPRAAPATRPEQQKTEYDNAADSFNADAAPMSSTAFKTQPDEGKVKGFDFYRDPLNAKCAACSTS